MGCRSCARFVRRRQPRCARFPPSPSRPTPIPRIASARSSPGSSSTCRSRWTRTSSPKRFRIWSSAASRGPWCGLLGLGFGFGFGLDLPLLLRLGTGDDAFEVGVHAARSSRIAGLLRGHFEPAGLLFLLAFLTLALALALLLRGSRFVHAPIVRQRPSAVIMIRAI